MTLQQNETYRMMSSVGQGRMLPSTTGGSRWSSSVGSGSMQSSFSRSPPYTTTHNRHVINKGFSYDEYNKYSPSSNSRRPLNSGNSRGLDPCRMTFRTHSSPLLRATSVVPQRKTSSCNKNTDPPMKSSLSSYRLGSPQLPSYRTRDHLIDSIIHTRTNEHRVMPGFFSSTNWDDRQDLNVDCDEVFPRIFISNGKTIHNTNYLKQVGVTHVLNTAEHHVNANPNKFPLYDISYYGFHVDDHPSANISRFFPSTSRFIEDALTSHPSAKVVVNCVMGWSRSATVVAAYLMANKGMSSTQAIEHIRRYRPIRPNPGFLQQLANYDNMITRRSFW